MGGPANATGCTKSDEKSALLLVRQSVHILVQNHCVPENNALTEIGHALHCTHRQGVMQDSCAVPSECAPESMIFAAHLLSQADHVLQG